MKGRILYSCFVFCIYFFGLSKPAYSQTINAPTFATASVCPGSKLDVRFTTTGTFLAGNKFTIQLSNANGTFSNPTVAGTSSTSGTVSVTLPDNANGTNYKFRIVSTLPIKTSDNSSALAIGQPEKPTLTASVASQAFCQSNSPGLLAEPALSDGGVRLRWYADQSGGSPLSGTPRPTASGDYFVSQVTASGCESERAKVTVTITPKPARPDVAGPNPVCSGANVGSLSATASAGNKLRWWGTSAQGGSYTDSPPPVSNTNSATYYVSQATSGGCDSDRTPISVQIKEVPGAPDSPTPIAFCQGRETRKLTATPTRPLATVSWYDKDDKLLSDAPEPSTSNTGTQTYYVRQTLDGCRSTERKTVQVTVNRIPDKPSVAKQDDLCEGTANKALSAAGNALKWYSTNSTGGTPSSSPSIVLTSQEYVGKTTNYYVSQTVDGCESERAAIPVNVKDTPDAPGVSAVDFCQGTASPVLTAGFSPNTSPNWYGTSATGGTSAPTAPTPDNTNVATTIFYVSQTLDGCEGPRAGLSVRVKPTPGAPGVSPVAFCNNGSAQALTASGERLQWFDAGDNPLPGAPTPDTRTVGNQLFRVSQTNGEGCVSPKAELPVVINALPGQPSVLNLTYCQSQRDQPQQNVQPLSAIGQNLRWYNTDGNAFPNAPTPGIDVTGTTAFNVSQTVNNCEGPRATLLVTVQTTPVPTIAKSLYTYCVNDVAKPLEATAEAGGSLRWLNPYGTLTNEAPTPPTLNTNIDPLGDPFYVYQIGANGCYSARATIRVVVNTVPTLSLTAPTPSVNLGLKTPLRLRFTGSGPYSYTLTGNNTGTSRSADTTINVLPRGNTTYQVINVTNGCGTGLPGNPATALVTVQAPTLTTSNLSTTTLCAGTSLPVPFTQTGEFNPGNVFQTELVSVADTSRKVLLSASATGSPVTAPLPTTIAGGQYYVRVKASNPDIGVTGSNSPTVLTVRSLASASLIGTQSIYEGSPASLTVALGGDGPWTITYADSLRSYSATSAISPLVTEARPTRTTTYRLTAVTNSCGTGAVSGAAVVTVLPLLATDDNPLDPLVKAYPVPTGATLTIELDLALLRDPAVFSLTDSRGRTILQTTTRNRRTDLDLSNQSSGMYILRIQVGEKQTTRKVVKL